MSQAEGDIAAEGDVKVQVRLDAGSLVDDVLRRDDGIRQWASNGWRGKEQLAAGVIRGGLESSAAHQRAALLQADEALEEAKQHLFLAYRRRRGPFTATRLVLYMLLCAGLALGFLGVMIEAEAFVPSLALAIVATARKR